MRWLPGILLLLLMESHARAMEPVVVLPQKDEYLLGRSLQVLEDESCRLEFEDVRTEPVSRRFEPNRPNVRSFGFKPSAFWFRFQLVSRVPRRQPLFLEIAYPMLDRIDFWIAQRDGTFEHRTMGDRFPHGNKIVRHSSFLIPLQIESGQRKEIYLRVQTQGAVNVPLTVWTPAGLRNHEQETRFFNGFYYGFLVIMILYNLLLFVATRDRCYVVFVLYTFSALTFISSNDGLPQEYLWSALPWWANRVVPLSLWLTCLFGFMTATEFLQLEQRMPRWNRVLGGCVILSAAGAVLSLFIPYTPITIAATFWTGPCSIMIWIVSIISSVQGFTLARFFTVGWSLFFFGVVLISMDRLGWIPGSVVSENAVVVGFALNAIFVSIALADRVNLMRGQRERTQAELQRAYDRLAELDRLKSNFFANVSHELRTPLTLILTPLQGLLSGHRGPLPAAVRTRLGSMEGNTQRLLRLVNQLLDFSRIEAGGMSTSYELCDLRSLVKSVVKAFEPFAHSKLLNLIFRGPDEMPEIYTDPQKIEKVISNLVSNACKFTEPSGAVVVRIGVHEEHLTVAVKDTGIGISDEQQAHIFDRFHQVDVGVAGTGIGLALSRELVQMVGGDLKLDSEVGFGSTFTVRLPLGAQHIHDEASIRSEGEEIDSSVDATSAASALVAEMGLVDHDGHPGQRAPDPPMSDQTEHPLPTVLVVEENTDMRQLVSGICRPAFQVMTASSGSEALELITQRPPDLLITDTRMRGMDGRELLRRVREDPKLASIPVILLTAEAEAEQLIEGLEQGADDYLTKPFRSRELLARARNLVRLQRQDARLRELNNRLQQEVVEQAAELSRLKTLGRFLSPEVARSIIETRDPGIHQRLRRKVTVFRLELRGFEALVEEAAPEDTVAMLNGYLSTVTERAFHHGATINGFEQDAVVGLFGAPTSEGAKEDAVRCARMALDLHACAFEICSRWEKLLSGALPLPTMVISTGHVTVGNFGSANRMEYTAVGAPMDEIDLLLEAVPAGEVLCTVRTWKLIQDTVAGHPGGELSVARSGPPIRLFRLAGPPARALATGISPQGGAEPIPPPPQSIATTPAGGLPIGTVIGERYRIVRCLGEGGMGTVYMARDLKLKMDVALKLLRKDIREEPRRLERLVREVLLARLVSHANVAQIYDLAEWEGQDFICMEYLQGETLQDRIERQGAFPIAQGVQVMRQLCAGLGAAHNVGVIHRDLKPANVILEPGGRVVILDFSIARAYSTLDQAETESLTLVGTPYYMAPEQFTSDPVDQRADIYALGVVAFEIFTGRRPFEAESVTALAYQHVHEEPPNPQELRPDLPPRLVGVILRCLEKSPSKRFLSTAEILGFMAQL